VAGSKNLVDDAVKVDDAVLYHHLEFFLGHSECGRDFVQGVQEVLSIYAEILDIV
jgi:hypothetical protein